MAKVTPISEHFQHFLAEMKETFWGDLYGQTKLAWQRFFELQSERQRDRCSGGQRYERRPGQRRVYRNGYYERNFVTRLGTLRLRIARTRRRTTQILRACNKGTPQTHKRVPKAGTPGATSRLPTIRELSRSVSNRDAEWQGFSRALVHERMQSLRNPVGYAKRS
jgi:hypothetical protein